MGLLTSKIELAFFDWVQVGRGLGEELGSELHRQRNFFWVDLYKGRLQAITKWKSSDSDRRVQTSHSYCHEDLTSTLYPVRIQCNSYLCLANVFVCRFTERNDTYIFVPEGDAQSLSINRSSGELSLNCRSYLSEIYDMNTNWTCSAYVHDSTFGAPFGHCNLWNRRFNFPINMYKPPSSMVESH